MSGDTLPPEGLPERLPQGERLIWQGRPAAVPLSLHAFRIGPVAAYFTVLLAWRTVAQLYDGDTLLGALIYAAWILPLASLSLVILAVLGWASARTTVYTVTDRRVAMRVGVALPITVNIPFTEVVGASVMRHADGSGDIALQLMEGKRIAYAVIWPHARPWHYARPEPTLRSIPDVDGVADLIAGVLSAAANQAANAAVRPARDAGGYQPGFATAAE